MAVDEPTRNAALRLGESLSMSSDYSSVGISEENSRPILIVYLRRNLRKSKPQRIPNDWEGIPVRVQSVGSLRPLSASRL